MSSRWLGMALAIAYPNLDPFSDYEVVSDQEGTARIGAWRAPVPRPTSKAMLETATLLAARAERKNALALQEQLDLEELFGDLAEFQRTAVLEPADPRIARAKELRAARRTEEKKIESMGLAELSAHRTRNEVERGK